MVFSISHFFLSALRRLSTYRRVCYERFYCSGDSQAIAKGIEWLSMKVAICPVLHSVVCDRWHLQH